MTRKDYILIADAINKAPVDASQDRQRNTVARSIADALATDNPRFDRARFLKACGL